MQATLPVRTISAGWTALMALALAVAIFAAAALAFTATRPAAPAVSATSGQAVEQALIEHRAGERESLGNASAVEQAPVQQGARERDQGLGSSVHGSADAKPASGRGRGLIPE